MCSKTPATLHSLPLFKVHDRRWALLCTDQQCNTLSPWKLYRSAITYPIAIYFWGWKFYVCSNSQIDLVNMGSVPPSLQSSDIVNGWPGIVTLKLKPTINKFISKKKACKCHLYFNNDAEVWPCYNCLLCQSCYKNP